MQQAGRAGPWAGRHCMVSSAALRNHRKLSGFEKVGYRPGSWVWGSRSSPHIPPPLASLGWSEGVRRPGCDGDALGKSCPQTRFLSILGPGFPFPHGRPLGHALSSWSLSLVEDGVPSSRERVAAPQTLLTRGFSPASAAASL